MATVGYTVTGLNAATKALKIGNMKVLADGLTAAEIIAKLSNTELLRQADLSVLEDSIAVDNGQ